MNLLECGSGWDSLLILVIFVVLSALSNWTKRKPDPGGETVGDRPHPTPPQPLRKTGATTRTVVVRSGPGRPQASVDWQEVLRGLLAGEPPAPAAPPPVPVQEPRTARSSQTGPAPRSVSRDNLVSAESLASLAESQAAYQKASQVDEAVAEQLGHRASLAESTSAYQHASQLDQTVAGHLRDVTSRPVQPTAAVRHRIGSPEIAQTKAMFRRPAAARQAVIASVILGPPRGLET